VSGQLHAPAALPPGKEPPGTNLIGGWTGPYFIPVVWKNYLLHAERLMKGTWKTEISIVNREAVDTLIISLEYASQGESNSDDLPVSLEKKTILTDSQIYIYPCCYSPQTYCILPMPSYVQIF
jgi:hypothetical protein